MARILVTKDGEPLINERFNYCVRSADQKSIPIYSKGETDRAGYYDFPWQFTPVGSTLYATGNQPVKKALLKSEGIEPIEGATLAIDSAMHTKQQDVLLPPEPKEKKSMKEKLDKLFMLGSGGGKGR